MKQLLLGAICALTAACASLPESYDTPAAPAVPDAATAKGLTRTYFVDGTLSANPCTHYNVRQRSCGNGRELAFDNLSDVNAMAQAGDTILLRGGTYTEQVAPRASGGTKAPIIYRAFEDERVQIAGFDMPAIWLVGVQHIEISGLEVHHVQGWGRLENAHNNTIEHNNFHNALARGTTGGLKLVQSHYNRIRNNTFYRGHDSIVVQNSDRNLITDNHLEFARHSLFSIRCGNFNIVRNNYLHNERQKIGEIYDCEGVSDAPFLLDATKRNLVEGNHFAFSRGSDQPHKYNGIQFAGQLGLVRQNLFKNNEGGAISFTVYADEALNNYGNRVVTNWFFDNRCYAVSDQTASGSRVGDNKVIGNLLSGNVDCLGYSDAIMRGSGVLFSDNEIANAPSRGLPLVWLARTFAAGEGTIVAMDDVLPFFDGYGIDGEKGDSVEIQSSGEDAVIVGIDYEQRTLELDRPLRWQGGDGVRVLSTNARAPFTVTPDPGVIRQE